MEDIQVSACFRARAARGAPNLPLAEALGATCEEQSRAVSSGTMTPQTLSSEK